MTATATRTGNARRALAASKRLGTALPKALRDAEANHDRAVANYGNLDGPGLVDAIVDALYDDRDPATDTAVVAAVVRDHVRRAHPVIRDTLTARLAELVAAHADALLDTWRPPFTTAADALLAAHKVLGDLDLDDHSAIVKLGADAASAWADAQAAVDTIHAIRTGASALALCTPGPAPHSDLNVCRIAAPTIDQVPNLRGIGAWDLVRAGVPLDLADDRTARQRHADRTNAHAVA